MYKLGSKCLLSKVTVKTNTQLHVLTVTFQNNYNIAQFLVHVLHTWFYSL